MSRVVLALLIIVPSLRAAAPTVDDLKKQMPKDQLSFVEKIEAHKDLQRQAKREPNDLKRAEAVQKVKASEKELASDLARKLGEGLKGWVGVYVPGGSTEMVWSVPDYFYISLAYSGMPEPAKEVARDLAKDDVTILTTVGVKVKVVPTAGAAAGGPAVATSLEGKDVKALEKH